jgi:membrane-associated phospholipid phosphatase
MSELRRVIIQHYGYFIAFLVCAVAATVFVSFDEKIDGFLQLNSLHHPLTDVVFRQVTLLGDGLFSIFTALAILFIWKHHRLALHIAIAFLISGIMAQLFKNIIAAPRPKEIIDPILFGSFFKGVTSAGWDSFPSGHTTSIFALATIIALHVNNKWYSLLLLVAAVLVGYSRIYMGCHFPADVIAGALLGTVTAVLVYTFINFKQRVPTAFAKATAVKG